MLLSRAGEVYHLNVAFYTNATVSLSNQSFLLWHLSKSGAL
ncbi:hypothetical protein [Solibacillus sp. R5-41]|nr:hypothetical protein [Solibacillus sp. R5-41]